MSWKPRTLARSGFYGAQPLSLGSATSYPFRSPAQVRAVLLDRLEDRLAPGGSPKTFRS